MLTADIMHHFGIEKDWEAVGFFETEQHKQLAANVRNAILAGRLVAITGPTGVGKTLSLNRLQSEIAADRKLIVARSLSIEKPRLLLSSLMTALFLDVSDDLETKIPTQPEKRERLLQELFRKRKKPVVLFIDEAHDLHGSTLTGLKRLMEIVQAGGGVLSIVLVGHPRLRNDLNRPTMEEIGHRTTKFTFEGLGEERRAYLDWLIAGALAKDIEPGAAIAEDALTLLAERLSTPLQFAEHLTRAFTEAFELGKKPVIRDIVEATLSLGFDDLDARLARMGYSPKTLAEQFDARPAEIAKFMKGKLDSERTRELADAMRRAGLPI
jgi:type II secretory pathway predicted ATPase ExeA